MLDTALLRGDCDELWLEIGFGAGEHLALQALHHPQAMIVGCEPYLNGLAMLLGQIEEKKLTNIRLRRGDARDLIDRLPDACLSRVFILYPDPWPKARHHKRRLVVLPFLRELARAIKPGGILQLATDDVSYAQWMLEHALACEELVWQAKTAADWRTQPNVWVTTRYESKALAAGRKPFYFAFQRR